MPSRGRLLDMSRLHSDDVYSRSVDTQIMRLRRKLEAGSQNRQYVVTKRGPGYRFGVPVETGVLTTLRMQSPHPSARRPPA